MLAFAYKGRTSKCVKPLEMVTLFGGIIFISLFPLVYSFSIQWMRGSVVQGWTTLGPSIWTLGGIRIHVLEIVVGEYIGKIYLETKEETKVYY